MSKHKAKEEEPNFQIRPPFSKKFKPGAVKVSLTHFIFLLLIYIYIALGISICSLY